MIGRINRREFMSGAVVGASACALGVPFISQTANGASVAPAFEILETKSISFPHNYYYGWPTVAKLGKQLLVVTSGGREGHVCPFGRVVIFRSYDIGSTWAYPQTLYDSPIDDRDAGICVTDRGTILATTFTSLAYGSLYKKEAELRAQGKGQWSDERFKNWTAVHERIGEEERQKELGCWMFRSTDGGITWSKRYSTPFNSPHGPIQISGGRLLYAGVELWTKERRVGAAISDDDGQTWHTKGFISPREGDDARLYHELHAVEASDGRLVAQIRNENKNNFGETLQSISKDGGETWSTPRSIGVWGLPSFLTRLSDGRLLMTYGHRRAPLGVQARVSADNGDTWSEPILIYGEGQNGDLGYPSTVQLDDGSLFTVWYESIDGIAHLRSSRWTIA